MNHCTPGNPPPFRTAPITARLRAALAIIVILAVPPSPAAAEDGEVRTWTDLKGRSLQARIVRHESTRVLVRKSDGREVYLQKKSLSPKDLAFLRSQPMGAIRSEDQLTFDSAKVDQRTFKKGKPITVGTLEFPQVVITPHFTIAGSAKVRADLLPIYAEAAERLYLDMEQEIPDIAGDFKDKRMAVWLVKSDKAHMELGEWYLEQLNEAGWFMHAARTSSNWRTLNIASMAFPPKIREKLGFIQKSRVFRSDRGKANRHRDLHWFSRIHFISSDILHNYLDPVENNGDYSLGMIRLGHSYFKEEQICGRIDTQVSFGSGGPTIEGFKNGRAWPAAIKRLLRNPDAHPSLKKLLSTDQATAQPMDVGSAYGLMRFIHHHPGRRKAFRDLLKQARESKKAPDPTAFAKEFGFDSPEAFDTAWIAYMQSEQFD